MGTPPRQLDLVEVGDAHAEVVGVAQQAQFERLEAHRLGDDGVGGEDVGAGRGDAEVEPVAVAGAVALHAACAVDHGDVRGHEAGQPDQVDVHGARFIGGAALAVAVEAVHLDAVLAVDGAHDHIFEREGDDAGVMRFGNGDRDGAGAVEDGTRPCARSSRCRRPARSGSTPMPSLGAGRAGAGGWGTPVRERGSRSCGRRPRCLRRRPRR